MPTLMLKLLALTGVISAGCFAVWTANTELQPVNSKDPSSFTAVEGAPEAGVGLGGEPLSISNGLKSVEEEPQPEGDQPLALANLPFPEESAPEEKPAPRVMPASFVPEQEEPAVAEETEPVPGVSSLENLEAAEKSKTNISLQAVGSATPKSPAIDSKSLRRLPANSEAPSLITIPKTAATTQAESPMPILPADVELPAESEPELVVEASSEPIAPGEISPSNVDQEVVPASDEVADSLPDLRPAGGRTRPAPNQPSVTEPSLEGEPNPFERSSGGLGNEPEVVPETEPTEVVPATSPAKIRSSLPTLIDSNEPANSQAEPEPLTLDPDHQPTRTPTHTHADGEALDAATPKSSLPRKPAEELLYGESTSEVPQMAPSQQPQLKIEKKAQAQAEVGEKFIYEIIVQNIGPVPAEKVVVEERIPNNCKFERSAPVAHYSSAERVMRWELKTMPPNTNQTIRVEVTPQKAGPVGSVATVRFASMVSTQTMVTAPTLELTAEYPKEVVVDEPVPVKFVLKNTGTGTARNVMLMTVLQDGLEHPLGQHVKKDDITLAPNESKEIVLVVTPKQANEYSSPVTVTSNGIEHQNQTLDFKVIPSYLTLTRNGHSQRFVKRPAESVTRVTNNSSKRMKDVRVSEQIPKGLEPVLAELGNAQWNDKTRTVTWTVPELGPRQKQDLKLTVVSTREGTYSGHVEAIDDSEHRAELDTKLEVRGFPALTMEFGGDGTAVAVGEQVSMQVTVRNRGSAVAKNVQAQFEVPQEMTFVTAKGPSEFKHNGNLVTFAELDELDPNTSQTYDIVLIAAEVGDPKVSVQLLSAERPDGVREEEAVTISAP